MEAKPWKPWVSGLNGLIFGPIAGSIVACISLCRIGKVRKGYGVLLATVATSFMFIYVFASGRLGLMVIVSSGLLISHIISPIAFPIFLNSDLHTELRHRSLHWCRSLPWGVIGFFVFYAIAVSSFVLLHPVIKGYYNLFYVQDYRKAVGAFDEAITIDLDNSAAILGRAVAQYSAGRYGRAIADYNKAILMSPDSPFLHRSRGLAYAGSEQYTEAIADYRKAIRVDPDYIAAHKSLASMYAAIGDFDNAVNTQEIAIDLLKRKGRTGQLQEMVERLGCYRAKKPCG